MSVRLRRPIGHLLLAVFFSTFATSLAASHLRGSDDPLCVSEFASRHPVPTIAATTPANDVSHCAVCHWMRAVAGAASYGPTTALPHPAKQGLELARPVSRHRDQVFVQSSPRAPPVSSPL
jgi:hypothetical protein